MDMPSNNLININSLLVEAVIAAKKASDAIVEVYGSAFNVELKEDRSPLTLADRRSHEIISRHLQALEKSLPLLSEEGRDIP
jgi:3'(2'), 5'-bisphosphate nucleotidase